jgi:hypothetical protein
MSFSIDVAWKSLNHYGEELCGDKVEIVKREDSDIVILSDGMGSGVKANILATLTSKILGTMFLNGAHIEDCVETIAKTLPICKVREVAYSTFSILQIFHDGNAYLVEFDNPACVFVRDGKVVDYPYVERDVYGKHIHEYRFTVKTNDCFVLMCDGVIFAGAGELLNYGWQWPDMAEYTLKCTKETLSSARLVAMLLQACDDLYQHKPSDDTTIAVTRVIERKVLNIFTGPPQNKEDDEKLMHDFMAQEGKKVVSGGTSANIAARVLDKEIHTILESDDATVPPMAKIEGLDLVVEGVLTLDRTLQLLRRYNSEDFDMDFFDQLDGNNGAAKLAKMIIEDCTVVNLFVGTAMNIAHKNQNLSLDLSVRMNLVDHLVTEVETMGKTVIVKYY